ncbi:hypothetical protein NVP1215B_067 [Vibrio phage 1.215.B._10N.222.54.F7]|nr:hypothetical protein NVP1215A_067 [Vibrio phage 1.215.A._10N.222.54.F7]AUR96090.1 hypothetical protein NVP1215B_067 [Vibrio phage 1.215.B._10N.222.54.F7]
MFKLNPIKEAIFEGFLQHIISIKPRDFIPDLSGFLPTSKLFTVDTGANPPNTKRSVVSTNASGVTTRSARVRINEEDYPDLPIHGYRQISLTYIGTLGILASNFENIHDASLNRSACNPTVDEIYNLPDRFGISVSYNYVPSLYLFRLYDPSKRLQKLYSFDFPLSSAQSITVDYDGEDNSRYRGNVVISANFTVIDETGRNYPTVSPTAHPIAEGDVIPSHVTYAMAWLKNNVTGDQYRITLKKAVTPTDTVVYKGNDPSQIFLAASLQSTVEMQLEPGVLHELGNVNDYSLMFDFPTTAQTGHILTRFTVAPPSALVSGETDRYIIAYVLQEDGTRTEHLVSSGFPVVQAVRNNVPLQNSASWYLQRDLYNALNQGSATYLTPENYNLLGVMGGKSMAGTAPISVNFKGDPDSFRGHPENVTSITYALTPSNNSGLSGIYWMVARRGAVWTLEAVNINMARHGYLDGTVTEQYNGVYGKYNAYPKGQVVPLSFQTANNGHSVAGFRLEYDLSNETLANNNYSAPAVLYGSIANSAGMIIDEIILAKFSSMRHLSLRPNLAAQPVKSLGYQALIRQGIDPETNTAIFEDLQLRRLSSTDPEHVYADVGVFLIENVTALPTVPNLP